MTSHPARKSTPQAETKENAAQARAMNGISSNIDVVYSHLTLSMMLPRAGSLESLIQCKSLILKGLFDGF